MIDGELTNQDVEPFEGVDIVASLDKIPADEGYFDVVICNAVLEHVINPNEVLDEFHRVLRPGGLLYLAVPFMQPEHLVPTDYQRYTADGLRVLVERHGFTVESVRGLHNVYTTMGWIAYEWLLQERGVKRVMLRWIVLPWLWRRSRSREQHVHSLASTYLVLALRSAA